MTPDRYDALHDMAMDDRVATAPALLHAALKDAMNEVDRLRADLKQVNRYGRATLWGFADRMAGIAPDACPHAMNDEERQHWDKGWQWRDDQEALKVATDERDALLARCVNEAWLYPGDVRREAHVWEWRIGTASGAEISREAAVAAVRKSAGLEGR